MVATLIRMYSVYTASVLKSVLYKHIPVLCTCVLLSFFLPRHGGRFPVVKCLIRPRPLFLSHRPLRNLDPCCRVAFCRKIFYPVASCARNLSYLHLLSFIAGAGFGKFVSLVLSDMATPFEVATPDARKWERERQRRLVLDSPHSTAISAFHTTSASMLISLQTGAEDALLSITSLPETDATRPVLDSIKADLRGVLATSTSMFGRFLLAANYGTALVDQVMAMEEPFPGVTPAQMRAIRLQSAALREETGRKMSHESAQAPAVSGRLCSRLYPPVAAGSARAGPRASGREVSVCLPRMQREEPLEGGRKVSPRGCARPLSAPVSSGPPGGC